MIDEKSAIVFLRNYMLPQATVFIAGALVSKAHFLEDFYARVVINL